MKVKHFYNIDDLNAFLSQTNIRYMDLRAPEYGYFVLVFEEVEDGK